MSQAETSINGPDFRERCFLFLTFLYAAAVHLVIHHALQGNPKPLSILLVVFLIAFVFSDWASRTRLPSLLPEHIGGFALAIKTGLEIAGVYFLVVSFILIAGSHGTESILPDGFSASSAFAVFLILTWTWDWWMVYVMKHLEIPDLLTMVFCGGALESKGVQDYLAPVKAWQKRREQTHRDAGLHIAQDILNRPQLWRRHLWRGNWPIIRSLCPVDPPLKAMLQFLANHMTYANALAGALILFDEYQFRGISFAGGVLPDGLASWLDLATIVTNVPYVLVFGLGILTPLLLALLGLLRSRMAVALLVAFGGVFPTLAFLSRNTIPFLHILFRSVALTGLVFLAWTVFFGIFRKTREWIPALIVLFTILVTYVLATPKTLMLLVASQQVLVNMFLHFAAGHRDSRPMQAVPDLQT